MTRRKARSGTRWKFAALHISPTDDDAHPTREVLYLRLVAEAFRFLFPVIVARLLGGALTSRIANNAFVTLAL